MSRPRASGKLAGASAVNKAKSKQLYQVVKQAIDRLDPIGLLAIGCPDDEYAPEIEHIVKVLSSPKVLSCDGLQAVLHETFVKSFDAERAGSRERYREAAEEIARSWGL